MTFSPDRLVHEAPRPSRPLWAVRAACSLLFCAGAACDRGGVSVSGDVPGLDTLGYRADSLLAQADRGPSSVLDSIALLKSAAELAATGALPAPTSEPATSVERGARDAAQAGRTQGQMMSQRAQARGDSMARAMAQQLAGGSGTSGRGGSDTLRGIVTLIGTAPAQHAGLVVDGITVSLSGMATSGMTRLEGVEVVVRGVKVTPRDIVVSNYLVRESDGVPAWDGILDADGILRLTDGSGFKRLSSIPTALRSTIGGRVWVAFKAGTSIPLSYGYIGRR